MTSQALVYNPKNINGSMYIDNSVNTVSNSVSDLTNNITSLYLSSQNYVIPSGKVSSYSVNNVNTLNLNEAGIVSNVPSNGVNWSSDGQSSVLLTCSENNIDLTPLIQNVITNNDTALLTFQDYGALYTYLTPVTLATYDFQLRDTNHFTYIKSGTDYTNFGSYQAVTPPNTFGFESTGITSQGIYGIWFQYAFSTAFIATSLIISVADYTQSPDIILVFGNNDASGNTPWSFVGGARYQFTALSLINNYLMSYPGNYSIYRVVIASANNTQFSISGIKFATNLSVSGGVALGTIANSAISVGNMTNNTGISGNTLTLNTGSLNINTSTINFNSGCYVSNFPIQQSIVIDVSRSESANLVANSMLCVYTWYCFRTQFTLQQLFMSVSTIPTGANVIVRADVYNSSLTYPFSYNNFVGSYNVSLSGTYYNTGYSSSISGIVLNAATANGPGGYIRFFVTQVGSTTPGAGLKITIFGQTSEIN